MRGSWVRTGDVCRVKDEGRRNRLENEARLFHHKLCLVQETRLEKREIERIVADQRVLDRRAALEKKEHVQRTLEQVCASLICQLDNASGRFMQLWNSKAKSCMTRPSSYLKLVILPKK